MEAWTDLYNELAERIQNKIPEIEWIDLWHDQVGYLTEELPFPSPAVFIGFNTINIEDLAQLIQECDTQIDFYLFFETFSDTYMGSYNKSSAVNFLSLLTELHICFHGHSGVNHQTLRRIDMRREDSGGSGNLYRISFAGNVEDASAQKEFNANEVNEITITRENVPKPSVDEDPLFIISS